MVELLLDALMDTVKLLPFLFLTYLLMEYIEHRSEDRMKKIIRKAGRLGPVFGGILGVVPQCGFSAAAAGFFAGRVITVGTLLAVFLSTSDEMLPILVSAHAPLENILRILGIKMIFGMGFGLLIDFLFRKMNQRKIGESFRDFCKQEHCHCEEENEGIFLPALFHTLQIALFLLVVSFVLNFVIEGVGEENLGNIILNRPLIGELLAALIGLLPNCAASVVITTLYMEGMMSAGAMMAGLLCGAGVGLLVLFRMNKGIKENTKILLLLYGCGVLGGWITNLLGGFGL